MVPLVPEVPPTITITTTLEGTLTSELPLTTKVVPPSEEALIALVAKLHLDSVVKLHLASVVKLHQASSVKLHLALVVKLHQVSVVKLHQASVVKLHLASVDMHHLASEDKDNLQVFSVKCHQLSQLV